MLCAGHECRRHGAPCGRHGSADVRREAAEPPRARYPEAERDHAQEAQVRREHEIQQLRSPPRRAGHDPEGAEVPERYPPRAQLPRGEERDQYSEVVDAGRYEATVRR